MSQDQIRLRTKLDFGINLVGPNGPIDLREIVFQLVTMAFNRNHEAGMSAEASDIFRSITDTFVEHLRSQDDHIELSRTDFLRIDDEVNKCRYPPTSLTQDRDGSSFRTWAYLSSYLREAIREAKDAQREQEQAVE